MNRHTGSQPEYGPPQDEAYKLYAPQPKGIRAWHVILVAGIVLALLCGGLGYLGLQVSSQPGAEPFVVGSRGSAPTSWDATRKDYPVIRLEVTGIGPADISWNVNDQGGSHNGAQLPWSKDLGPFDSFVVISMMAQTKNSTTSAAIRGTIIYGDKSFPCEGQGPYAVAVCSGSSS